MDWFNSGMRRTEERASELAEQKLPNLNKRENRPLSELWNCNRRSNFHVIRVLEGEKKEGRLKKIFKEVTVENFLNLTKDTNLQI